MVNRYLLLIESASVILQLWAAVSAIILGFYTKKTKAWLFITAALVLMVICRSLRFPELLSPDFSGASATDIAVDLAGLLISLLLALGITAILLLIRSFKNFQVVLEKQQQLFIDALDLLNREDRQSNYIGNILSLVKLHSGIEAVAIRLISGNACSYYQSEGFPEEFIEQARDFCNNDQEGNLPAHSTGNPLLECMCEKVIRGTMDSELPFFTTVGSSWTNSTSKFRTAATGEEKQKLLYKRCNEAGYESVALIPLHRDKKIIGLLQLNDSRKDCFTRNIILFWERFANSVGIALDRKQREEDLTAANKQLSLKTGELQSVNEELAQYNYVISHDIRSLLRAINNYADFLYEDIQAALEGEQKRYICGLKSAVSEADYLVERLSEFSRIGHKNGTAESIDLGVFLEKLIPSLNLRVEAKIKIQELWPLVWFDRLLLQQVFQNLLINAVKFNNSQPKEVELGWQQAGEQKYEIFIRDNGIGIDPRYQHRIFNVFERLHTREEYEGSGIGLAIVKKALHTMNGDIRVESNPGKGSTFFITLPGTEERTENNGPK